MRERGRAAGGPGRAERLWQAAPQRSPAARAAAPVTAGGGRSGRGAAAGGVSQSPGDPAAGRKEKCLLCRNEPGLPPPVGFAVETRADSAPVRSAMPSPLSALSPPPRLLLLARPAPAGRSKSFLVASPGSGALLRSALTLSLCRAAVTPPARASLLVPSLP